MPASLRALALLIAALPLYAAAIPGKPSHLRTDALTDPLGIDTPHPTLSWQLDDTRSGALQTAYRITVSSTPAPTAPILWDTGKVTSSTSTGIPYTGPALEPSHRYLWRVELWDAQDKPYPRSDAAWWETGLLTPAPWQAHNAAWIGYEDPEQHALRTSGATWITNPLIPSTSTADTHHDFRVHIPVDRPVTRAVLYTTGEDTPAAWLNGQPVLAAEPLAPWKQMPWGTYVRRDVTGQIRPGDNLLAIAITRYHGAHRQEPTPQAPMSTCLYLVFADGSSQLVSSASPGWKAALDAPEGWQTASASDASWLAAIPFPAPAGNFGGNQPGLPWPTGPAAALRRTFDQPRPVTSARLYATALGAYSLRLNGAPVGDQVLAPGWMDFRERVPYQVYDVTALVRRGSNALAATLAAGWYSTPLRWFRQGNNYGPTQPALRALLRLQHADGSVDWVTTDSSWQADTSPISQAEIYDGETLDARRLQPGWDTASFSAAAWHPAQIVTPAEPAIVAEFYPPIREHQVLSAKAITQPHPGTYIFDFGQNMSALPRLRVHGSRGDDIQLRFGEVLNPDGTLYTDNLRTAKATDHYILAGSPASRPEAFEPQFTFHGFRYAEITGLHYAPTPATLQAVVLHTDAPFTTRFSTGDPMVNQLWSNILWGQRSNFVGVPTDCPQRDERLGWSADAQVFWRTATFNMDLTTFSQKYAADLHGTQATTPMYGIFAPGIDTANPGFGAAWSDAGVIVPWTGWIQSGDPRIIEQNWDGMAQYLAEIARKNPDHLWRTAFGAAFGDWLTPTITTPEDLLATAYWAYDVTLIRQMALATGRTVEADAYARQFEAIKAAFQKAYVRSDGFVGTVDRFPSIPPPTLHPEDKGAAAGKVVETQTGYVLALYMDLLPRELRAAAADRLIAKIKANHWLLGTGFLGTPYLLEVLSDTGHTDVAYRLLLNRDYPSWGYLIEHGATTTWERWNGDQMRNDPSMNSYNHYAYGAVGEWLYRYAAGIDTTPGSPGFHTLHLHPNFDARLRHLALDYDSAYGTIHSDWSVTGTRLLWHLTVPPNTTASLPLAETNATAFLRDGQPLAATLHATAPDTYTLPAGTYTFNATLAPSTSP